MYMSSRVISSVVRCGEVEGLFRSCPGFVVVSMGFLGVVRMLPFVVLLCSVLLGCLCLLVACCVLFWLLGSLA